MAFIIENFVFSGVLFLGMVGLLEFGNRWAHRAEQGAAGEGAGALEGAVFALLGLLIAFTFSGAASRFDMRRTLATEEANALGTVALRFDLLPPDDRAALRSELSGYIDVRLATHRHRGDDETERLLWSQMAQRQAALWRLALAAVSRPGLPASTTPLVLGAMNDVFDAATRRKAALDTHPPGIIFVLLALLSLASSLLAGTSLGHGKRPRRLSLVVFALAMSSTCFITRDLEHPREGLIRVDSADQPLEEVRSSLVP